MNEEFNLLDEEPSILDNILGILSQNQDSSDSEICKETDKLSSAFNTNEKEIFSWDKCEKHSKTVEIGIKIRTYTCD